MVWQNGISFFFYAQSAALHIWWVVSWPWMICNFASKPPKRFLYPMGTVERSASRNDVNDEISMPGWMQYFTSYISLQWGFVHQQNSTATDPDPARNCPSAVDLRAVCQVVSRHLCRAVMQLQFSVVDKSGRNWFKSKHILLLNTWQNNYIFLMTHF
jgi:hypothetical protein